MIFIKNQISLINSINPEWKDLAKGFNHYVITKYDVFYRAEVICRKVRLQSIVQRLGRLLLPIKNIGFAKTKKFVITKYDVFCRAEVICRKVRLQSIVQRFNRLLLPIKNIGIAMTRTIFIK